MTHELCLPSTSALHVGPRHTWTAPDGQDTHLIDFVAVPQSMLASCTWSQTIDQLDLNPVHEDHLVVGLELAWTEHIVSSLAVAKPKHLSCNREAIATADLSMPLSHSVGATWNTDIETHVDKLNCMFAQELKHSCPKRPLLPKKAFLTDALWALRRQKLCLRRRLQQTQHAMRHEDLARVFHCWRLSKTGVADDLATLNACSFNFACTLRCSAVASAAKLWIASHRLKAELGIAKKQVLANKIEELTHLTSASDILSTLKPFIGSSNALKQGPKPLPFILDEEGRPCQTAEEAMNRWISFFKCMEGGQRMTESEQRQCWLNNLRSQAADSMEVHVVEVPSLVELEAAFRRVKKGKASGPDHLPSELFHYFPVALAKQGYSVLLKMALQGQESLIHKGGTLIPLWKGKGNKNLCTSFRSILLSSHFGKTLHRAMRLKQADVYETYLHAQQLGGRRATPVTLGAHQARAFLRHHRENGRPTALLFLDLTEAFYRVVRPLALSGELTDEVIGAMAARLHLDADVVAELRTLMAQPGAIEDAQLPMHAQRALRAIHTDTHFHLRSQTDVCRTSLGSRPGDAFADVVFGYLWAKVLHKLTDRISHLDLGEVFPADAGPAWFDNGLYEPTHTSAEPFLGPCWCDDLCVCMSSSTLESLQRKAAAVSSSLIDLCKTHGMTPNLNKGKTELMFSMRGPGQRQFRQHWFGPNSNRVFPALGDTGLHQIPIVGVYRHLGGFLHHSGDLKQEIRRRIGIAHQAFNAHRKLLFQNHAIILQKRVELFRCLVLSKLLYGTDSWVIHEQKTKNLFHAAVMKLYKRLLRVRPDAKVPDDLVLSQAGLPSPTELLRVSRLRYLKTLFNAGKVVFWGLLNADQAWCQLIEDDFLWMYQQLWNSSSLKDPKEHLPQWLEIIQHHPGYWKRLTTRAMKHAVGQRARLYKVVQTHQDLFDLLRDNAFSVPAPMHQRFAGTVAFGCMSCGLACRNKAGEGAHMFKAHGITHPVRQLFQSTQCAICLTEYHSFGKLKMHLIRSARCRQCWYGMRSRHVPMPGLGSIVDDDLKRSNDGLIPPLRAEGPLAEPSRRRDFSNVLEELYEDLALIILHSIDFQDLESQLRERITKDPLSWTRCAATLSELHASLLADAQDLGELPLAGVLQLVSRLQCPHAWPFLLEDAFVPVEHFTDLAQLEDACGNITWDAQPFAVPRMWGKHRLVLHAFAGRRRPGDFQFYLDRILETCADGILIHAVSMDIIYDTTLGDASLRQTQEFWYHGIERSWVVGFIGGPPCETWSKARGVEVKSAGKCNGPRIIRTADALWGLEALGLKELAQISMGNDLLLFSIMCLYRLAIRGGVGILEHPAEPESEDAAFIWKLRILVLLTHLPGVEVLRILQGHFGAPSPKPTQLLTLNLPGLPAMLNQCAVCDQPPKRSAIGLQADGQWATAKLKEYPPSLCLAFARSFYTHLCSSPSHFGSEQAQAENFLAQCQSLIVQQYSDFIGKDFAG